MSQRPYLLRMADGKYPPPLLVEHQVRHEESNYPRWIYTPEQKKVIQDKFFIIYLLKGITIMRFTLHIHERTSCLW